jgi:hypothetical protein
MTDLARLGIAVESNAAKATADLDRLAGSAKNAQQATDQVTSAAKTQATMFDRLRASYDPLYAAQMKYRQALSDLKTLQNSGAVSAKQYSTMLAAQKSAFAEQVVAINKYGDAARVSGGSLGQLSFQINDIATGLVMGQSPFQIMAQQGGQVFQIWQMNNNVFKELGTVIRGLITPTRLALGGVVAIGLVGAAAANSYIQSQKRMMVATKGLGAASGATVDDLERIAEQAASTGHVAVVQAEAMEAAYVQTGRVGKENLLGLISVTKDFATQTGLSVDDATAKLAKMASDPMQGIDDLAASIGGVTGRTRELIQEQIAQGNQQKAIAILTDAARRSLDDYRASQTALGRLMDSASTSASNFWHDLGKNIDHAYDSVVKFKQENETLFRIMAQIAGMGAGSAIEQFFTPPPASAATGNGTSAAINRAFDASKAAASGLGYDQLKSLQDEAARQKKVIDEGFPGLSATQAAQVTTYYHNLTGAIQSMTDANGKLITQEDIRIRQNNLAVQALNARTPTEMAAIARQQTYITLIGQNVSATQAAAMADSAAALAFASAQKALDDQNKAITLSIAGNVALADAYAKGGAAAMVAQAQYQAMQEAITTGIDVQARARQLLTQAVSGQIASLSQDITAQQRVADITGQANKLVAAGALSYDRMNDYIQDNIGLLQLEDLRKAAVIAGNKVLIDQLDKLIVQRGLLTKQQHADEAQGRLDGLRNPHAQDITDINGLRGTPGGNAAIGQTSLFQSTGNVLNDLGQSNPFGKGAQIALGFNLDAIRKQADQYTKIIDDAAKASLIGPQQAADARVAIEEMANQQIAQSYAQFNQDRLQMTSDFFGNLAALSRVKNKEIAAIGKAAAIIQATIDGYLAVQKALAAYPPPWNFAMAAAVGVATAANVAAIAGFADGVVGVTGPGTGTSDSILARLSNGESVVTASATARNRNTLAAMNNGASFDGIGRAANMNINISQEPGVAVEVVGVTEDEVNVIARRIVHTEAATVVAHSQRQPNGIMAKATRDTVQAKRLRR